MTIVWYRSPWEYPPEKRCSVGWSQRVLEYWHRLRRSWLGMRSGFPYRRPQEYRPEPWQRRCEGTCLAVSSSVSEQRQQSGP